MTEEHFDQALRVLTTRLPYQAFTVELNGGERFEIDFPSALSWRDGAAVFQAPGGVPVIFDHDSVNAIIAASSDAPLQ